MLRTCRAQERRRPQHARARIEALLIHRRLPITQQARRNLLEPADLRLGKVELDRPRQRELVSQQLRCGGQRARSLYERRVWATKAAGDVSFGIVNHYN